MSYEFKDRKVITKSVEYSASYHCNLRCSACSHLSPFIREKFPSIESFSADVNRLSGILHAHVIRLLGGEPLLNTELTSFIEIAQESGIADIVMVTTNGLLLHKMDDEFWKKVDAVLISLYPDINLDTKISRFKAKAKEFSTQLWVQPISVFRTTFVTTPHPMDWITNMIFKTCQDVHVFQCHMVHEGRLYKCPVPPFLAEYLSRMGISGYDSAPEGFNIHQAGNTSNELKKFLMSEKAMEACRYCLGSLGKTQDHYQLDSEILLNPGLLNITRENALDRNRLVREMFSLWNS